MGDIDRSHGFRKSHALVVGITAYGNGFTALRNAAADALEIAGCLARQGYDVTTLIDGTATRDALLHEIHERLPGAVASEDRLLVYFAGHGVALNGDDGPEGYLIPRDARVQVVDSYVRMRALNDAITALTCRHVLAILDCCFAGSFRWSATRDVAGARDSVTGPARLYQQQYERFVRDPAWQVITSSGADQEALDFSIDRRGPSDHSPFASALLAALDGSAPQIPDLVTATRLYVYLRDAIETTEPGSRRQTPGLYPLRKHDKGEYIFQPRAARISLEAAPPLDSERNPYRGLTSFDEAHHALFFGRTRVVEALDAAVVREPCTFVVASSGAGKSSLVKAGLLPRLRLRNWQIAPIMRPAEDPIAALEHALASVVSPHTSPLSDRLARWHAEHPERHFVIIIDQLEELSTMCRDEVRRQGFLDELAGLIVRHGAWLRIVATLRADFEPFVRTRWGGPPVPSFPVPRLRPDELRDIIERPAELRAVFFEDRLVDEILASVEGQPEVLPLLSHVLSELYASCASPGNRSRTLTREAYDQLGGVAGAIAKSAQAIYDDLVGRDGRFATSVRNVMLRLVESGPGPLARRRVRLAELEYADLVETARVRTVVDRLIDARLLLASSEPQGAFVEPAHDAVLREWELVERWLDASRATWDIQRDVMWAAQTWHRGARNDRQLWVKDPRLSAIAPHVAASDGWLDRVELEFVRRSLQVRRAQQRRLTVVVSSVIAVLAALAIVAWTLRGRAETRLVENRRLLGASFTEQGRRFVVDEQPLRGLKFLADARSLGADTPPLRRVFATATQALWTTLVRHGAGVAMAVFSPDGKRFATASYDGTARVWDTVSGAPITPPLVHGDAMVSVKFAPDGGTLITASRDHTANLWDARTGERKRKIPHPSFVLSAEITRDGRWLVTSCEDGLVRVFDAATGEPSGGVPMRHAAGVKLAITSPDSRHVLAASHDGKIKLWDLTTSTIVAEVEHFTVETLAFSPTGDRFATTGSDQGNSKPTARIWSMTGRLVAEVAHGGPISVARFSPDGQRLATASNDGTARVWDAVTGKPISSEMPHRDMVRAMELSPDGARLVTGCYDGTARVWDATSGVPLGPPLEHGQAVESVQLSPDGSALLTASGDSTARIWHIDDTTPLAFAAPLSSTVEFSGGGSLVMAAGQRQARVWDARTAAPLTPVLVHPAAITSAVLDPDRGRLITAASDGEIRIWAVALPGETARSPSPAAGTSAPEHEFAVPGASRVAIAGERVVVAAGSHASVHDVATGALVAGPVEHGAMILAIELSPDGGRFLTAGGNTVDEWDARSGARLRGPWVHADTVQLAHYAADGQHVVVGNGSEARVWPGPDVREAMLHRDTLRAVSFDPSGQRIVTASDDDTARIWDATTYAPIGLPMQHDGDVTAAAWSPDGTCVVTASRDQTVRVWDASSGQPLGPPLRHDASVGDARWSPQGDRILTIAGEDALAIWPARLDARSPATWSAIAERYGVGGPLLPSPPGEPATSAPAAPFAGAVLLRATNLLASALAALPYQAGLAREYATAARDAFVVVNHPIEAARARWVLAAIAAITAPGDDLFAARREVQPDGLVDPAAFVVACARVVAFELDHPVPAVALLDRVPPSRALDPVETAGIYLAAHRHADAARIAGGARSVVREPGRRVQLEALAWAAGCLAGDRDGCRASNGLIAAYRQLRDGEVAGTGWSPLARALRTDGTTLEATDLVTRVLGLLVREKTAATTDELRRVLATPAR